MSKVLIDRALLERAVHSLELAYETDTPTVRDICAVLAAPSGTPAMPVKAYYHEWTDLEGVRTRSVGLEVRKAFIDAPLVLESDALTQIACLEGEIAKRDEGLAACRVAVENCELFRARIAELERQLNSDKLIKMVAELRSELAAIKAQEPVAYIPVNRKFLEEIADSLDYDVRDVRDKVRSMLAAPVSEAKAQGVYSADPLACTGCKQGCFRCLSTADHVEGVRAMVAEPSPAGVDGLNTDRNAAFKACPESGCDWGSFYLGWKARGVVEQAIIDGLRGEADQQAQRIGELERLLLRVQVSLSLDDTEWGYSGAEKYKLLADIRAALAAGNEPKQCT